MGVDPLSEVIALLRPRAVFSKVISAAGRWAVRYSHFGQPSFCAVLEGSCVLAVGRQKPLCLMAGDFVLLPATPGFTMSALEGGTPVDMDARSAAARPGPGEIRHGTRAGPADMRMLGGYFAFDCADSDMLVSLLPVVLHVRGVDRLRLLVQLVREESLAARPGRELVLGRLVDLLLVEALRASPAEHAPPGLLRGLADPRLAAAFRHMHAEPGRAWTVEQLARKSALSRSAFFDRFARAVGVAPMEYLLSWRMAMAKDLLRRSGLGIGEVAQRVGYGSASTFSTAFSRHVGQPPGRFARADAAAR